MARKWKTAAPSARADNSHFAVEVYRRQAALETALKALANGEVAHGERTPLVDYASAYAAVKDGLDTLSFTAFEMA